MLNFNRTNKILLIGPDPNKEYLGGVAYHMKVMKSLGTLRNAIVSDPGSIDTLLSIKTLKVLFNTLNFKTYKDYSDIFINSSIYSTAFMKLLLILMGLNKRKQRIRVFFHGGRFEDILFLQSRILRNISLFLLKKASSIHFLSRDQGQGFHKIFPQLEWQLFKNYLPFDKTIDKIFTKQINLLFVGRIVTEKGIYEIINAMDKILETEEFQNVCVQFAGDGPELENLRKTTNGYSKDRVHILGRVHTQELDPLYAKADILLLPSYHKEGLPYVILEAMRAGLPIIVTSSGALADVVKDGVNGLIIPPKDSEALSNAIFKLLRNKELCESMKRSNIEKFQSLFSKKAADRYYSDLLTN